ncbi:MAG: peptidyl-tRNA hydrolase, family [Actinomycetota bacterium]|nr:peptidyl-tRNA hydrolase, family [Actinomycetota bacterium]
MLDRAGEPVAQAADDSPWLVIGLGNPGPRYEGNRHNLGAMVVERLAADLGERLSAHRCRAAVAQTRLRPSGAVPGPRLLLARPSSYMNESGGPVCGLVRFFRVRPDRLLIVHDELDLPLGRLRLKRGGGEGGHNGLKSISKSLGSKDYNRLRLGIGRPPGRMDPADYVLRDFSGAERSEVPLMIVEAVEAVEDVLRQGWDRAQGAVNAR